jgi:hypothetical protein
VDGGTVDGAEARFVSRECKAEVSAAEQDRLRATVLDERSSRAEEELPLRLSNGCRELMSTPTIMLRTPEYQPVASRSVQVRVGILGS